MGVTDRLGPAVTGIDGALQNSEDLYIDKRPYRRVQKPCHTRSRQSSWGNVCVTRCVFEYSRENSRVYVQQETSSLLQLLQQGKQYLNELSSPGKARLIVY